MMFMRSWLWYQNKDISLHHRGCLDITIFVDGLKLRSDFA